MNPTQTMTAPSGYKAVQKYTPQQMQLFQGLFSNVSPDSFTARLAGGDEAAFQQAEAPAMRQFNQLQGENASRFSGMGMGARKGSGFQNYQNQATSDFAQDLQSRRMDLQRNALKDLFSMSHDLLGQEPYAYQEKKKSFLEQLLGGAAPLVGGAAGFAMGGPAGALTGFNAGSKFSESFQ